MPSSIKHRTYPHVGINANQFITSDDVIIHIMSNCVFTNGSICDTLKSLIHMLNVTDKDVIDKVLTCRKIRNPISINAFFNETYTI